MIKIFTTILLLLTYSVGFAQYIAEDTRKRNKMLYLSAGEMNPIEFVRTGEKSTYRRNLGLHLQVFPDQRKYLGFSVSGVTSGASNSGGGYREFEPFIVKPDEIYHIDALVLLRYRYKPVEFYTGAGVVVTSSQIKALSTISNSSERVEKWNAGAAFELGGRLYLRETFHIGLMYKYLWIPEIEYDIKGMRPIKLNLSGSLIAVTVGVAFY